MQHEIAIRSPERCSKEERAAFIALAGKSNEVEPQDLESGFDRARFVLWTNDARVLTGVSALKIPRQSYREGVFTKAKSALNHGDYPLEFGYLYVEEDRRKNGYGRVLVKKALSLAGKDGVFATTREANKDFHPFLVDQGFVLVGEPYKSKRGEFNLLLFVRAGTKEVAL